jgi:hypothetical protein
MAILKAQKFVTTYFHFTKPQCEINSNKIKFAKFGCNVTILVPMGPTKPKIYTRCANVEKVNLK